MIGTLVAACGVGVFGIWFVGSSNPVTPAGYVGYLQILTYHPVPDIA